MVAGSLIYRGVYEFIVLVVPMGCLRNEGLEVLKEALHDQVQSLPLWSGCSLIKESPKC